MYVAIAAGAYFFLKELDEGKQVIISSVALAAHANVHITYSKDAYCF